MNNIQKKCKFVQNMYAQNILTGQFETPLSRRTGQGTNDIF